MIEATIKTFKTSNLYYAECQALGVQAYAKSELMAIDRCREQCLKVLNMMLESLRTNNVPDCTEIDSQPTFSKLELELSSEVGCEVRYIPESDWLFLSDQEEVYAYANNKFERLKRYSDDKKSETFRNYVIVSGERIYTGAMMRRFSA